MTLSLSQIHEAEDLVKHGKVQLVDSHNWIVYSVSGNGEYKVQAVDRTKYHYDLYCKCKGWQFAKGAKDCKHCEAVRIFSDGKYIEETEETETVKPKRDPNYERNKEWIEKTKQEVIRELKRNGY